MWLYGCKLFWDNKRMNTQTPGRLAWRRLGMPKSKSVDCNRCWLSAPDEWLTLPVTQSEFAYCFEDGCCMCVCVCQEEASVGKDSERGCGDDEGVIDYHRLTNYSVYLIIFRVILHLWNISKGKIWWPWCQILARPIEIQLHIWDVNVRSLKLTRQQPRRFPLEWQKKKLRLDEMHPLKLHDRKRNMQQPNFHGFPPAFVRMSYFSCLFDAVLIAWGQSKGRCHSSYQGPNLIKNHQNMNRQSWLCSRSAFEVSFSANLRILISGRCSERSGWSPTGLGCSGSIPRCEKALQVLKNAWFLRFFNDYLIWFRFLSFCFFPHHLWLLLCHYGDNNYVLPFFASPRWPAWKNWRRHTSRRLDVWMAGSQLEESWNANPRLVPRLCRSRRFQIHQGVCAWPVRLFA